jgi:hypothetical protein
MLLFIVVILYYTLKSFVEYVVWEDLSGNEDIFFRASGNEGNSFGSIKNLSNNEANSFGPQIISSGNNVYVVWYDDTPGNFDIFFKKGVD